jgi:hypothetical protein
MEEVFKFGQMVQDMMVFGLMVWQMVMVDSYMQKVMYTKVNGQKTKPMAMEFTLILMVVGMKVSGFKINSTDMVLNNGQTVQSMKGNMNKE